MNASLAAVARWMDHHLGQLAATAAAPPDPSGPEWFPPEVPDPVDEAPTADRSTQAVVGAFVELAVLSGDPELITRAAERACTADHARRVEACRHPEATEALSRNPALPWSYRRRAVLAMPPTDAATQLAGHPGDLDAWAQVVLDAASRLGTTVATERVVARHPEPAAVVHRVAQVLFAGGEPRDGRLDRVVYADMHLRPATVALMPVDAFAAACAFRPDADPPTAFDRAATALLCAHLGTDPSCWASFAALLSGWDGPVGQLCQTPSLLDGAHRDG